MTKSKKKLVPESSVKNAITALEVSYGYVHSHLVWNGRSTVGDSMLQQISAAINGLGGRTPQMGPKGSNLPSCLSVAKTETKNGPRCPGPCDQQHGDPHLYCKGYCSH